MSRYTISRDDPDRAARAVIAAQFRRPMTAAVTLLILAAGGASGAAGGGSGAVLGVVIAALAVAILLMLQRKRLRAMLSAGALRPGTALTVTGHRDGFEVRSATGSIAHAYADVQRARERRGMITLFMVPARFVVVLPRPAVPDEVRSRLLGRRVP